MNNRHSLDALGPHSGKRFRTFPLATAMSLVALAFLLSGTGALADPIRIVTSGNVYQLVEDGETGFTFAGADFNFSAGEVQRLPAGFCNPCVAGTSVDLSSTMTAHGPASATVDGRTYGSVYFGGDLTFNAGSVIVPDVPDGSPGIHPTASFTFTGTLFGFADPARTGAPLFSTKLSGSGTASLGFFNYEGNPGLSADGFRYQFEAVQPTPEPGSMLLFGTGAAWMISKRKRRSKSTTA